MKIEVGKFYKTRNGNKVKVVSFNGRPATQPWAYEIEGVGCRDCVDENGFYMKPNSLHSFDLIEEWKDEMKIEVGKYYKTRAGRKARVICTDRNHTFSPVVALLDDIDAYYYNATGTYRIDGVEGHLDLVSEYSDWDDVAVDTPVWFRVPTTTTQWTPHHFCKFEDGRVFTFSGGTTSHSHSGNIYLVFDTTLVSLTNPNTK